VETAATLVPESGVQLLIDAIKPFMGNRFGKSEKLIVARDFSIVKLAMRGYKNWTDVRVKALPAPYSDTGVELSTCHGAKGREWQYVFLINVVEGEFPYQFKKEAVKLEEERRLFYVAASRASKKFFIVESPVCKNNFGRSQKYLTNLESQSTFVGDYRPQLKAVK
jgi:superfamily I DNA/RNA helicase